MYFFFIWTSHAKYFVGQLLQLLLIGYKRLMVSYIIELLVSIGNYLLNSIKADKIIFFFSWQTIYCVSWYVIIYNHQAKFSLFDFFFPHLSPFCRFHYCPNPAGLRGELQWFQELLLCRSTIVASLFAVV